MQEYLAEKRGSRIIRDAQAVLMQEYLAPIIRDAQTVHIQEYLREKSGSPIILCFCTDGRSHVPLFLDNLQKAHLS
jgi:hypothetical protein